MNNTSPKSDVRSVEEIYAQLNPRDIEQFYAGYQRWHLQQQIAALQARVDAVRQQIVENTQCMQEVHPSAIALAALARLQAKGVSDIDLLDRMLERGENWLDQTMQRLDYCEQVDDFICGDYTQWCRHALEGAYDWIDSIQNQEASTASSSQVSTEETLTEATEELLLQKLSSDKDEDEASMLEATLKRPAVAPPSPKEPAPTVENPPSAVEVVSPVEAPAHSVEEAPPGDATPASLAPAEQVTMQPGEEYIPLAGEPAPAGDISLSSGEQPNIQEYIAPEEPASPEALSLSSGEQSSIQEYIALEEPHSAGDTSTSDSEPAVIQEYVTVEGPSSGEVAPAPDAEQPAIHEYIFPDSEEHMPASDNAEPVPQEYAISKEPLSFEESTASHAEQPALQEYATPAAMESRSIPESEETTAQEHATPEEPLSVENTAISGSEQPTVQEPVEITPVTEEPSSTKPASPPQDTAGELSMKGERSDAGSVGARFIAPWGGVGQPPLSSSAVSPPQDEESTKPALSEAPATKQEAHIPVMAAEKSRQDQQNNMPERRPNFLQRLFRIIWGD